MDWKSSGLFNVIQDSKYISDRQNNGISRQANNNPRIASIFLAAVAGSLGVIAMNGAEKIVNSTFSTPKKPELIWIDSSTGVVRLVNLETTRTCILPSYPGKIPAIIEYLDHLGRVAACGSVRERYNNTCYSLTTGSEPAWVKMHPMPNYFCNSRPNPYRGYPTRISNYVSSVGWFMMGDKRCDRYAEDNKEISTQLLTVSNEWKTLPNLSPFRPFGLPEAACSVTLNSTHIIVIGQMRSRGDEILDSWILNLQHFTWTRLAPLIGSRYFLLDGCVLTPEQEVMVMVGYSKPYIYNPTSNTWREDNLRLNIYEPTLFLWDDRVINIGPYSDRILQKTKAGYEPMEARLGDSFSTYYDVAILVPGGSYECS